MNRINQKVKIKEPVRLRVKSLSNGNKSLYLDTYYKGKRVYEFLRLYLVPEKTAIDRAINTATMQAATAIKAERILAFIRGNADIKSPETKTTSIREWIGHIIKVKTGQSSESSVRLMVRLFKHLRKYKSSSIAIEDIDREFCIGFADYLRNAKALNSTKPLMQATQFELQNALSIILNEAVRADLISNNPMRLLNASERIKKPESTREYLTPDEVKSMIDVAGDHIKTGDDIAAFLFCCFCGLRYSDVFELTWDNLVDTCDGRMIVKIMKKTRRRVEVPVSESAASLLPKPVFHNAKVFSFPLYSVTARRLKKVAEAAGIRKKVTFHVSRHTFATMMLTAGADLYTISKLIGHTDIRTTQIYSKVVDKKKRDAITLLDKLF